MNVQDYLIPCREKNLKSKTVRSIFGSIDSILDCNKIILELFEKRISQEWNFNQKLGDVFMKSLVSFPAKRNQHNSLLRYHHLECMLNMLKTIQTL